ncbi:MAG: alpha/beta fold hydrolase [Betaproteobacteria bacterium]|nr:alpha/beta fold hydrolase [Betaproteobacteria bacterium]
MLLSGSIWRPPSCNDHQTSPSSTLAPASTPATTNASPPYLAEGGFLPLVYDYRGIGRSRPQSMRGFEASVEEWGSKDCAAVLDWLAERFPGARRIVIGHSVGGFLTGFARNGHLIDHMVLVGAHTGYWGDYAPYARPWMYLLWHAFMPAVTRLVGYFPGRWLHMLEDLPRGVALEWAARRKPDFWWNARGADGQPDVARIDEVLGRFRSIHASVLALRFEDDPFATVAATERVLGLYSGCTAEQRLVTRADAGGQKIRHFGFFAADSGTRCGPSAALAAGAGKDSRDACG